MDRNQARAAAMRSAISGGRFRMLASAVLENLFSTGLAPVLMIGARGSPKPRTPASVPK